MITLDEPTTQHQQGSSELHMSAIADAEAEM
jgi:hypothetical protein